MADEAESLTSYNYAGNNPVMFNDPLGNNFVRLENGRYQIFYPDSQSDFVSGSIEAMGGAGNYYTKDYVNYLQNQALAAYGIKVYDSSNQTAEDLVNIFNNGKLETGKNGFWQVSYNHGYADVNGDGNEYKGSAGIIAWGNNQGEIGYRNIGNWHGSGGSWDNENTISSYDKAGYINGSFGTTLGATEHLLDYTAKSYSTLRGLRAEVQALGKGGARTLAYTKLAGRALGVAGIGITIADGFSNGWKAHHIADIAIGIGTTFVLTNPIGFTLGTLYFVGDLATKKITGRSITENIFD